MLDSSTRIASSSELVVMDGFMARSFVDTHFVRVTKYSNRAQFSVFVETAHPGQWPVNHRDRSKRSVGCRINPTFYGCTWLGYLKNKILTSKKKRECANLSCVINVIGVSLSVLAWTNPEELFFLGYLAEPSVSMIFDQVSGLMLLAAMVGVIFFRKYKYWCYRSY